MATKFDQKTRQRLILTSFLLWPRYLTSPCRKLLRLAIQKLISHDNKESSEFKFKAPKIVDPEFDLFNKGYLYIENFLDDASYRYLLDNWPKKRWFEPLRLSNNDKSYDSGFRWTERRFDESIKRNHAVLQLYEQLKSVEFCDCLTEIANDDIKRRNLSLMLTQAYSHSYLTPHQDSMGPNQAINNSLINIIYFVEANGRGWEAGGTSIFADATFSKPLLIPQNLNNSVLLYRTSNQVWHGFPKIKFRKFRKTLLAHYWCAES